MLKKKVLIFGVIFFISLSSLFLYSPFRALFFDVPSITLPSKISFVWANTTFDKCRNITVTNAGSTTLTRFPAYINITNTTNMLSDYRDIRFFDEFCNNGGNLLAYEIENYTANDLDVWVRIPSLPSTNKIISLYYKNDTNVNSGENITGVWDSNYRGVWHLPEDPGPGNTGDIKDSTSNNNDGTASASMTTSDQVIGQIDGSINFDGNDDLVNLGDVVVDNFTLSAWINVTGYISGDEMTFIGRVDTANPTRAFEFDVKDGGNLRLLLWDSACSGGAADLVIDAGNIPLGIWNHVSAIYNSTTAIIYINGSQVGTGTLSGGACQTISPVRIGNRRFDGGSQHFNGTIDEVRISNTFRSSDWINMSYQITANQGSFVSFSVEESEPSADTQAPQWFDNSSNNTVVSSNVLHSIRWTDDTALDGFIFSFANGSTDNFINDTWVAMSGTSNHSNVTKFINNTVDSVIQWRVYANDTAGNLNVTDIFNYTTTSADSCSYSSGNWVVDCTDSCVISSNVVGGGTDILSLNGNGVFTVNAIISNFQYVKIGGQCKVRTQGSGEIRL